MNFTITESN